MGTQTSHVPVITLITKIDLRTQLIKVYIKGIQYHNRLDEKMEGLS